MKSHFTEVEVGTVTKCHHIHAIKSIGLIESCRIILLCTCLGKTLLSTFSSVTHIFSLNRFLGFNHTQRLYKKVIVNTPLSALQATPHKVNPAAEVNSAESHMRYVSRPGQTATSDISNRAFLLLMVILT